MGLLSFSLTLGQRNVARRYQKTCVAVATGIKACSFCFMNSPSCAAVTGLPEQHKPARLSNMNQRNFC